MSSRAAWFVFVTTMLVIAPAAVIGDEGAVDSAFIASEGRDSGRWTSENAPSSLGATAFVPGELLVGLSPEPAAGQADALRGSLGATLRRAFPEIQAEHWRLPPGLDVEDALRVVARHPAVRYAEPNYIVHALEMPNDPLLGGLWGLHNVGQTGGTPDADIDAPEAWDLQTGSTAVVVGIIDTGVDYLHEDLVGNIWTNPGEDLNANGIVDATDFNGLDDDGNGKVDDLRGWDCRSEDNNPMDDHNHGTHVAGTVGARGNNGIGVVGVNWIVRLMPLKFLSASGFGTTSDAIECINYAASFKDGAGNPVVRITSNSWGGGPGSKALKDAIAKSGALFVAAAGNSGKRAKEYPAAYDLENIISVAATDHNDALAGFSSFGADWVDLGAPGVDVLSAHRNNAYGTRSGTSMASPHVSGVAALLMAQYPTMTNAQVKATILNAVDPLPSLQGKTLTGGRLNAFRAVSNAQAPEWGSATCAATPSGLVGWWSADGHARDIAGSHNGTLRNGATFAAGMVNQAFELDGTDDYVEIPDSDRWAFARDDFTINLWLRFDSQVVRRGEIFIGNDEGPYDTPKWIFGLGGGDFTAGHLNFHVNDPALGVSEVLAEVPFSKVPGTWYLFTVRRDADTFTISVNETQVSSETVVISIPNAKAPLTIGQAESDPLESGSRFFFDGRIDEVQIFSRALSAEEIETIFDAGSTGVCKPLDTEPPTLIGTVAAPDPAELGGSVAISTQARDDITVDRLNVEIRDSQANIIGNFTMTDLGSGAYEYVFHTTTIGTFEYRVVAVDTAGNAAVAVGSFVVQDTTPPVANAGPDQTVLQGTVVTFDGTGSFDLDGIAAYGWAFNDEAPVSLTGPKPSHRFDTAGTYIVTLTATDPSSNRASDMVLIIITPASGTIQGTVIDSSGRAVDGATVRLLSGSTEIAMATTGADGSFRFANVAPGLYTLQVSASGYETKIADLSVAAGQTTTRSIPLTLLELRPAGFAQEIGLLTLVASAAAIAVVWIAWRRRKAE